MTDRLAELSAQGVAVWLDDLSRVRLTSGSLKKMLHEQHVVGVTTNPSIFQKALSDADAYDAQVKDLQVMGVTVEEAVRLHAGADYTVAFCGFSPGFAYLTGLPAELAVPRRPSPRPLVPAGAVGLAGSYCGVYPRPSPGGWQLIGRTELRVWDATRADPALLVPGTRVHFVPSPSTTGGPT